MLIRSLAFSEPLYLRFNSNYTDRRQALEKFKEVSWTAHTALYGRGSTMYRTNELYELIFQGIPDSLRNELWLVFSGAIHEVRTLVPIRSSFRCLPENRQSECLPTIGSTVVVGQARARFDQ